jgi:hypothetical protein
VVDSTPLSANPHCPSLGKLRLLPFPLQRQSQQEHRQPPPPPCNYHRSLKPAQVHLRSTRPRKEYLQRPRFSRLCSGQWGLLDFWLFTAAYGADISSASCRRRPRTLILAAWVAIAQACHLLCRRRVHAVMARISRGHRRPFSRPRRSWGHHHQFVHPRWRDLSRSYKENTGKQLREATATARMWWSCHLHMRAWFHLHCMKKLRGGLPGRGESPGPRGLGQRGGPVPTMGVFRGHSLPDEGLSEPDEAMRLRL